MNLEKKLKQELCERPNCLIKDEENDLLKAQLILSKKVLKAAPPVTTIYDKKIDNTDISYYYKNMDDSVEITIYNLKNYFPDITFTYGYNIRELGCRGLLNGKWIEYEESEKKITIPFQLGGLTKINVPKILRYNGMFGFGFDKKLMDCGKIEVMHQVRETNLEKNRIIYGTYDYIDSKSFQRMLERFYENSQIYVTNIKPNLGKQWSLFEVDIFKNIPKKYGIKKEDSIVYIINNFEITDIESLQEYLKENEFCADFAFA